MGMSWGAQVEQGLIIGPEDLKNYNGENVEECFDLLYELSEQSSQIVHMETEGAYFFRIIGDGHGDNLFPTIDKENFFVVTLKKQPSYFEAAYNSVQDMINEIKSSIGEFLPEDFNYEERICAVDGASFA